MAEPNDAPDTAALPDAVEAPAGGGKKKKIGALLVILPLALLPAGVGGYLAFSQYPRLVAAATAMGFGTDDAEEEEDKPIEYGQFMELDGLIINPAGTDGTRYLMVTIGLEGPNPAVLEEVTSREIVVRDTILKVLSRRTVAELADVGRRNELKTEIVGAVNAIARKGKIERMYFTKYVLQ